MALLWYEDNDCGVDERELFDLLRTHGFVDGSYATADADTRRRIEALGVDIIIEVNASVGERAYSAFVDGCVRASERCAKGECAE